MKHFGGGVKPPPKRHLVVADMFVPSFVATADTTFGGGRCITCVLCLLFNLRPKLPSRCVVLGSWSIYFFGCCLVNYCGGWLGEFFGTQWFTWEGAPCQVGTGPVKLAGLSSKSTCNILLHLEFRVQVWRLHSCVQFAVPADWEAPGWVLFSSRWA